MIDEAVATVAVSGGVTRDGSPVFDEPWQGRAFALAVETVARLQLPWDAFRTRLIAAIAAEPHRAYYESWLDALEAMVLDERATSSGELDHHRGEAAAYRVDEIGNGEIDIFPIAVTEPVLRGILDALFTRWWPHIRFGPIIQGAVYELRAPHAPELSMLDGYLTIGFADWHVHLCIGTHTRSTPEVARLRRCAHAELARVLVDDVPTSWMFRMYNGAGEQMLTVLLPNPFLDDDQQALAEPDWSRLACWDELRAAVLGLAPDPLDRAGTAFVHP